MSTVGVFVLQRDGRAHFMPLSTLHGPRGEFVVFQYLSAGDELAGLRVKLCGSPLQDSVHVMDHDVYVTLFCKSLLDN